MQYCCSVWLLLAAAVPQSVVPSSQHISPAPGGSSASQTITVVSAAPATTYRHHMKFKHPEISTLKCCWQSTSSLGGLEQHEGR